VGSKYCVFHISNSFAIFKKSGNGVMALEVSHTICFVCDALFCTIEVFIKCRDVTAFENVCNPILHESTQNALSFQFDGGYK
jgi:hypothetical protein